MEDERKTREQLLEELGDLRGRVARLEAEAAGRGQAEEALRESEKSLRDLIESMADGFSVLDDKGVHIDVNPALCRMTGFSREELVGTGPPHPYWPEEEYEHIEAAFQKALAGEFEGFELTFKRKNGKRFPVIVSPSQVMDDNGNVVSCFATVKDITDRKRAEEELRYRAELVDQLETGINLVRPDDGTLLHVNPQFETMFGYEPGELAGKHVSVLNAPGERDAAETVAEIIQCLNETGRWSGEIKNIRKDGSTFWCHAKVVEVDHPKHGRIWASVHDDIPDRKRMEKLLRIGRDLAIALSAAPGLNEGLRVCLDAALEASGMDCGGIYT